MLHIFCIKLPTLTGGETAWHDDVIKWKHFPRYWPFARGIHRSPVNSPHKGQWRGALMFSLICSALNKQLSKQSWGWWFEMLSRPLWRHCNGILTRQCSVVCCLFNAWSSFMVPYVSLGINELKWCDELICLISVNAVFTPQQGNCSSQSDSTSITDEPQGTDFFQLIQVCLWSDNLRQMRDQVESTIWYSHWKCHEIFHKLISHFDW